MPILIVFVLGVANFAMHKAVLESSASLLARLPRMLHVLGGRFSLAVEFVMLLGAMIMVAAGSAGWLWAYLGYSAINGVAAYLILSDPA